MVAEKHRKYYMFQDGNDVMFVINIPPEQLDDMVLRIFQEEVHLRGLDRIIFPNVEEIIRGATQGEVVRIGSLRVEPEPKPREPEVDVDVNGLPFTIEVSPDGMQAFLELENPALPITRRHIDAGLARAGIRFGVIEESIEVILRDWPNLFHVLVAEGMPPKDGEDAQLRLEKSFKNNLAPQITDEGHVDFKQLNLISPIDLGDILQVRMPPTPGEPGHNVFGRVIPAVPGKNRKLVAGQNTQVSEDGTQLLSTIGGFLHLGLKGDINVRPVYTVNGDVDYSTGIVHFKNDVLIRGDVRAGFSVKAGGDVHIYGAVEDAIIEAGRNVIINGGILSSGTARVKAGGDVSVGFIQNAHVEAGGSVFIRIESIGSRITAGKDIEVLKHNGRIVAGELDVGGWVVAQVIGSENCPEIRIKFRGMPGAWDDPDTRYEYCFVSTRRLESPIKVMFGSLVASISGIEPPLTISVKGERILIENLFIGPDQLKLRRKDRERKEQAAAAQHEVK